MSGKAPDFESPEYDNAETIKEDAFIDACQAYAESQSHAAKQCAFDTAALQFAVGSCLNSCLECLELLYVARESQPISDVALAHDSWRQEEEPEPCSRDSWLRGAIPEGPILTIHNTSSSMTCSSQSVPAHSLAGTPNGSIPLTGTSIARRASLASTAAADVAGAAEAGNSSLGRISVSRGSGGPPSTKGRAAAASSVAAKSLTDAASGTTSGVSSSTQQTQKQATRKQPAPQQHNAEERLRQELQIRRQQEAIAREMKQKDEQARAALIAMQKELKGKDYTYDPSGKVVLLNKINPESLPVPPGPQFKVHSAADRDPASLAGAKQGSTARNLASRSVNHLGASLTSTTKSSSSGTTGKNSKSVTIPSCDFKQTASQTQPAVIETLKPAAGVVLRAGAAAKQGAKRESTGQTRAQYQQQAKAHNQQATRKFAVNGSDAGVWVGSMAGNASIRAVSASSAAVSGVAGGPNGRLTPQQAAVIAAGGASGRASPAVSAAAAPESMRSALSTRPQQVAAAEPAISDTAPTASSVAASAIEQRPASPDVNLVLVAAADWGMVGSSSGYIPPPGSLHTVHKASDKQIKEEFGRTAFLPKVCSPTQTLKPPKVPPSNTGTSGKLQSSRGGAQ